MFNLTHYRRKNKPMQEQRFIFISKQLISKHKYIKIKPRGNKLENL